MNNNLERILALISKHKIQIGLKDGNLRLLADRGSFPDAIRQLIAEHKDLLIDWLTENTVTTQTSIIPSVDRSSSLPLSYAQQRLWFLAKLEGPSAAYTMPLSLRLRGEVDIDALKQSLQTIVARHEALRTRFIEVDGEGRQVIDPPEVSLDIETVSSAVQVQTIVDSEGQYCFDLDNERLCRLRILHDESDNSYVLLVTMHHSVSDGWSMGVFFKELVSLYQAFSDGEAPVLEPLPIQYGDYASWQRGWLQGEVLSAQLGYWQEQLAELPPLLSLPTDRPRPAQQSYRGAVQQLMFPKPLMDALLKLSREQGVTLFMTLLTAFQVLLNRYSGQSDIAIGTPVANRRQAELEPMIGFFVNTLVMRGDLSSDLPFADLLARTKEVALGAYGHQDIPFEQLVEAINPERSLSHSPLFQVMFALQNVPMDEVALKGAVISPLEQNAAVAKYDLSLSLTETDEGLAGSIEYSTDLFNQSTVVRLIEHYQRLLETVVAAPYARLSTYNFLSPKEQFQQISEWNATSAEFSKDMCIHELFERQAAKSPGAPAVFFKGETLTYEVLNARSNKLANYLMAQGVGPDILVGLCVERSFDMLIGMLGILKAGGAYVPLDPGYPLDRHAYMLADTNVEIVLTQIPMLQRLATQDARLVCLDDGNMQATLAKYSSENPKPNAINLTAEHLAYTIYTSGSTGVPKGVGIAHRSCVAMLHWARQWFSKEELSQTLASTSMCFDLSIYELFLPLTVGTTVVLIEDILELPELEAAQMPTLINTVPSAMEALCREGALPNSVSVVNLAGEALSAQLVDRVYAHDHVAKVYNLYGPSEDTTYSTGALMPKHADSAITIGRPLANGRAYILASNMALVPTGVLGELYLGGEGLARSYIRKPALTAERFVPDPFSKVPGARLYRTGDMCRWLPNGDIEFVGRVDDQVKVRGFRIELGEIECQLAQLPAVKEAVVLARDDEGRDKRLVGYVVPNVSADDESDVDEQRLMSDYKAALSVKLPAYMVPSVYVFMEAMPLTNNGKVDRKALPEPDESDFAKEVYVAPSSEIERKLCVIWQDVLGLEQVGIQDNFFALGGESINSIQVVSLAKQQGMHFKVRQIFEHLTIAELAPHVKQEDEAEEQRRDSEGVLPLTPIKKMFFDWDLPKPNTFNQLLFLQPPEDLDITALRLLVESLFIRHDVLRLCFTQDEGEWLGEYQPFNEVMLDDAIIYHDFSEMSDDERSANLGPLCEAAEMGIDLEVCPLFRAVFFDYGDDRGRLLLVMHHLIVDVVSWGIMLSDLQTGWEQICQGDNVHLPQEKTSYQDWVEAIHDYAYSESLQSELGYWLEQLSIPSQALPVVADGGVLTSPANDVYHFELDKGDSSALLRDVNKTYRTQVNELLLAALLLAYRGWTDDTCLRVELETHGREEIFDGVNVNETVGWFTAMYPLVLATQPNADIADVIKGVKEHYRAVPNNGIGYGILKEVAQDDELLQIEGNRRLGLVFNYVGQFGANVNPDLTFAAAREYSSKATDNDNPQSALLTINGMQKGDNLVFYFACAKDCFEARDIERFMGLFKQALVDVVVHCKKRDREKLAAEANQDVFVRDESLQEMDGVEI